MDVSALSELQPWDWPEDADQVLARAIRDRGGDVAERLLAVHELGECNSPQAAIPLLPLLSDADQEVRIAAYEALLQRILNLGLQWRPPGAPPGKEPTEGART